jgi:hypothetical protein
VSRAVEYDKADENGMFGEVADDAWGGRSRRARPTQVHPAVRLWADGVSPRSLALGGAHTAPFASPVLNVGVERPAANEGGIFKSAMWKFEEQQMEPDDRMGLACRITTRLFG